MTGHTEEHKEEMREENGEFSEETRKKAILVGARFASVQTEADASAFRTGMAELKGLADACGYETADVITQNIDAPDAATCIGSGKVQEIRNFAAEMHCGTVIFNNTLSPSQLANLSDRLDTEVLDRTSLILEIFGQRARSAEARMQVEYAKLQYMLPRLVGLRKNLSRQGGAGGSKSSKGAGEQQIELDRRRIEKRMSQLRHSLKEVEQSRSTQRKKRRGSGLPVVSLVGYTNAGKSTLLNAMIRKYSPDDEKLVLEKDMLFATLDTTIRRISPDDRHDFLLADTVGFISDLPHDLVDAFRSTLEEARLADLILEVVDYSDENHEMQMDVTRKTLSELGIKDVPIIYVMNKSDLCTPRLPLPVIQQNPHGDWIFMSASEGTGLDELTKLIGEKLFGKNILCGLLIPYTAGNIAEELHRSTRIRQEEYREDGIFIKTEIPENLLYRFSGYRINDSETEA